MTGVQTCALPIYLRILGYSGYGEEKLDVSKNPLLEFIDFHEIRNEKLDFSANPLLEELHIDGVVPIKEEEDRVSNINCRR